uniref:Uncharacterized protein n=1 Tax=Cyanistes caeruleus TaxID=156563 RepID=A0A8C0ZGJ8_CYACU
IFSLEAVGFGKGAALCDAICKPPPPFPTDNKPVPLKTREHEDYMLALQQDLRGTTKKNRITAHWRHFSFFSTSFSTGC